MPVDFMAGFGEVLQGEETSMRVGLIGYGKMGKALFHLLVQGGHEVTVVCRTEESAKEHEAQFLKKTANAWKRAGHSPDHIAETLEAMKTSIRFSASLNALEGADAVMESMTEDLELKKRMFQEIEKVVSSSAWILTNTSSLSIDAMADALRCKERFCGFHLFHPTALIPLVEIVTGQSTSPSLVEALFPFARGLGRTPIRVADGPGSVINGILVHYYAEAVYLIEEGLALPSEVDQAAKRYFYVGPIESIDTIGIELFLTGVKSAPDVYSVCPIRLHADADERTGMARPEAGARPGYHCPALLLKVLRDERMGRAAGKGIYLYQGGKAVDDDPMYYLDTSRFPKRADRPIEEEAIVRRLLYAVLNGALWILHLGVATPEAVDIGVQEVLQMKEGPVAMMRRMGYETVREQFDALAAEWGLRFHPPNLASIFQ